MLTHRQRARRKARGWQIAAAVCVALAAAAVVVPLDKVLGSTGRSGGAKLVQPDDGVTLVALETPALGVSVPTLKELFPLLPASSPIPEDTEEGPGVVGEPPTPAPPAAPSGVWEYIGSVMSPTNKRAFVRVDQQQHLLAEGAAVENTKVVAITPTELTIETAGARRVLALNQRTSDFPTTPPKRPVAFRTPPNPGMAQGPGVVSAPGMGGRPGMGGATPPPSAPSSFDQMRAQAAREAAAKGVGMHPMDAPRRMSGEHADMMRKMLSEKMDPSQQREVLQKMGFKAGMQADETMRQLKESGVELNEDLMGAAKELEGMNEEEAKKAEEAGKGG